MATAGLNMANPYSGIFDQGAGQTAYDGGGAARIQQFGQAALAQIPSIEAPQVQPRGEVLFSPSKRQFFVNGVTFAEDDDATIAQAEQLLDRPSVGRPTEGDWVSVTPQTFGQIVEQVRNPSLGRLFAKNFGIGVDQLQLLAGYGLQLAGAEDTGGAIVRKQMEEIQKSSPYQRNFTDIASGGDAVDWFVATLGQQGPNLIESIAAAAIGAAAGTAAGGPGLGTAAGTVAGLFGKQAFKQKVLDAAKRYATAKAKGAAPSLDDIKTLRNASALTGAVATSYLSNYATGVADIYGEMREQGADADDTAARMQALIGGIPYAALESTGEFLLASRIFGGIKAPRALPKGATRLQRGLEYGRRGAVGLGVGATAEGLTEVGQEALVMGLSGQDLASDEAVNRFINSFAAGAAVGGAIGGVANLKGGKPKQQITPQGDPTNDQETNLLDTSGSATQQAGYLPRRGGETALDRRFRGQAAPGVFGPQGVLDLGVDATTRELRDRARQLGSEPARIIMQWNPQTMREEPFRQVFNPDTRQIELQPVPPNELPTAAPQALPGQLALQFAPPAPSGIGFTEQQPTPNTLLAQQMQAAQRRQQEDLAQQQLQQQQAAERERQMNLMEAQRQQQIAEEARIAAQRAALPQAPILELPMVPIQPRAPRQLPLFPRRELPVPSRGEGLRRGVGTQVTPAAAVQQPTRLVTTELDAQGQPRVVQTAVPPLTAAEARRAGQIPLFTQEGQPSVAALRAAGQRGPLPTPVVEEGATQIPPTGANVDVNTVNAARQRLAAKRAVGRIEYDNGDVYEGQLKNGVPNGDGIYYIANGDVYVGKFKNGLFNGKGQYLFADGSTYVGDFKDDRREGQGVFTDVDGTVLDGKFEDNDFVPPEPPPAPAKGEALKRGRKDAVQKQGAKKVSARRGTEARAEVGEEVPGEGQAAREGQAQVQAPAQVTPLEEPFTPKTMAELEAEAAAQRPLRTERAPEPTASELVDGAIAIADSTVNQDDFVDAASNLMFHAYVDTDTNNKAANAKARKFVEETEFDAQQRQALNDALVDEINIKGQIELFRGGEFKPVYAYLTNNGLLPRLDATTSGLRAEDAARLVREGQLSLTNLTDKTAKDVIAANPDLVADEASNLARGQKDDTRENPASRLAEVIRKTNLSETRLNESTRQQRIADIQARWDALPDEQRDFVDETGTPLSEYFEDDTPKITIINGKLRITKQTYTEEQVAAFEADDIAEVDPDVRALEAEEGRRTDWDAWNRKLSDGNFSRADGTRITQPLAVGRIRMAVTKFLNKLAIKPRVFIYKDQADLKARNPRLHQRAAESRPQGDFDSVQAAGFAFGDGNVIIFSDYIATEQQLNFVLAHETLGHFGLRGIIPAKNFDALMERIYRENPAIQGDVDAAMAANEGMGRAEAVEEYLADFAGILDTSIVARVWNAIKGALNKLGIEFGDESARYFISQARKYVRNGGVGVPFEVSTVINRLHEIEYGLTPTGTGRFAAVGDLYRDVRVADLMRDKIGGLPMSFEEAISWFKGQGVNTISSYDSFKAKFLSLANFRARENPGAQAMENLIEEMRNISMSIKVEMNERLREVLNKAAFGKYWGITDEQLDNLNRATYAAQRLAVNNFDRSKERSREPLYRFVDGVLEPNQPEIDRLKAAGRISFEQMRDGFNYQVVALEGGKEVTKTERFEGIPGLTEDSIEWKGYQQLREAMDDVELRLLRARYMSGIAEQDIAFNEIEELMTNNELTDTDRTFLRRALTKYKDLYTQDAELDENGYVSLNAESMTRGNDFLVALNQAILGRDTDLTDKLVQEYFKGKVADDFATQLNDFKTRLNLPEGNKFIVQNRVKQLVLSEMANSDADLFTRRSIATGYTPILREGTHQMRVEAIDPRSGKQVQLKQSSRDQLIYSQYDSPKAAMNAAEEVNKVFGDNLYEVEAYDPDTGDYVVKKVKLRAVGEVALDSVAAPPELNLNEFVRGLRQFDIALTPAKMEDVVKALTRQNNAARNRLERAFVVGANQEATMAISRHIESRASTIAKTVLRPRMAELMNLNLAKTQRIWNGDPELLQRLKENAEQVEADPNVSDQAKDIARKEYERYQFMYDTTNPKGGVKRGMQYYNEASRTAAFLDGNRNVDESDFGSGPLVSFIRASTSLIQLGGSIATGVLNVIGAYTNGIPYLSTYNRKNGFGGGFGLGKSVAQFHIALKDVGGIGMNPFSEISRAANRAEFYDRVAADPELQRQYNLKPYEARFIAREIREGTMIPAQSNALVGTSRGRATKGWQQKFIDGWMMPFNLTEQASRRALGLAAFRLEYQNQKAAGKSDAEAESAARKFAVGTLQLTLGEYSVLNRPSAWRSGIQSFIYMYKVFPTTSIQLLANLPRSGQIGMLAGLFLLSGLTGLPFAEDLEDIIDTIAQKLGFRQGSIRFEIAKRIDEIMPGLSPYILTGVANSLSVGNIGIRTSLGNVFPGTGLFLSGANTSRELMDIAGPAASAITGTVKTAYDIARLPFSDQVTAVDIFRESPVTIGRAFGDAYAYAQTGAIVDRRGYMVSDDMTMGTIAARMLGFYPTAAADQYSMIRIAKRMTDYQRDTSVGFRTAWINAMQTGDRQRARSIEQAVDEWNKGARGTALEIRNFRVNSMRALREAQRPAGERALRSAPRAAREDIERLSGLLGY